MTHAINKTFAGIDSAWITAIQDVVQRGTVVESRVGSSLELIGYSFTIENPSKRLLMNDRRKLRRYYAGAELFWYLSRSNLVAGLLPFAPSYIRFEEKDGTAYGAYGARIARAESGHGEQDQLMLALEMLQRNDNSRQCIVALWSPADLMVAADGMCKDIPCTLNMQFIRREGKLHMIVNMRSNDLWLGTPYDCFCFMSIQSLMATCLGCTLGTYTHNVGSLHIYANNINPAKEAVDAHTVLNDFNYTIDECLSDIAIGHPKDMLSGFSRPDFSYGQSVESRSWMDDLALSCRIKRNNLNHDRHNDLFNQRDIFGEIQ